MDTFIRWVSWTLIILSALAFFFAVLSVIVNFDVVGLSPESYSRACSNLALLAIAIWFVGVKKGIKKD